MVGKWHLGEAASFRPNDRGFDEFFGFLGGGHVYLPAANAKGEYAAPILRNRVPVQETRYLTDAFGEEAVAFLARQQKDKPFGFYLAFNAVHHRRAQAQRPTRGRSARRAGAVHLRRDAAVEALPGAPQPGDGDQG